MPDERLLTVFTTTSYPSLDDLRARLAVATLEACARRGIPVVVCDSSPEPAVAARFRELGAIVFPQADAAGGKGGALREALARAVALSPEGAILAFQEPEKVAMVELWERVCARAEACRAAAPRPCAGVVAVPAREPRLFAATYPIEQVQAEGFLNSALNAAARDAGLSTSPPLDLAFGPFALDAALAPHWLALSGRLWDAQVLGVLRAWRAGAAVCAAEVPYRHPAEQTAQEQGQLAWILKRQQQLALLVPAACAELRAPGRAREAGGGAQAAAAAAGEARCAGAPPEAGTLPGLARLGAAAAAGEARGAGAPPGAITLIVITGAGGNLGLKLARYFLACGAPYRLRLADRLPAAELRRRLLEPAAGCVPALAADLDARAQLVELDLSVWSGALGALMEGAAVVLHLAAVNPFPHALWAECAQSCDVHAHTIHAAVRARVRRFVLASSNHVMGNHWTDGACALGGAPMIGARSELRPGTEFDLRPIARMAAMPYSAAKLFGERLCASVAQYSPMEVVIVRIGWCQPGANARETLSVTGSPMEAPADAADSGAPSAELEARRAQVELWFKNMWLSNRDLERLFRGAVDAALPGGAEPEGGGTAGWAAVPARRPFCIVNGVSANRGSRWCLENPIAYVPLDDVHVRPDDKCDT